MSLFVLCYREADFSLRPPVFSVTVYRHCATLCFAEGPLPLHFAFCCPPTVIQLVVFGKSLRFSLHICSICILFLTQMSYDNVRCDIELTLCLLICKCTCRSKAMSFMIVIILLQRERETLFCCPFALRCSFT